MIDDIRLLHKDKVASTNDCLKQMAAKGEKEGVCLYADFQTRGMGNGERGTGRSLWMHLFLLVIAGVWCCALSFLSAPVLNSVSSLTGVAPIDVLIAVLALVGVAFVLLSANATIVQSLSGGD